MKKVTSCLLVLLALSCLIPLSAQSAAHPWSFGVGYAGRNFDQLPDFEFENANLSPAVQLRLGRYLSSLLDLDIQGAFAPTNVFPGGLAEDLADVDALLRLKLANGSRTGSAIVPIPFIQAGVSAAIAGEDLESYFHIPAGLGLRLQTGDATSLDIGALYRLGLGNLADYVTVYGGFNLYFGRGKTEETPPPPPVDTDNDGIADINDDCPTEAGLALFKGCPDSDNDGVADKDDECPEVAGLITLKGCPEEIVDTDGDGIADEEDACPTIAGLATFEGCPDTDSDGIQDKEDDCPEEAGLAQFNGCPDTDGDSIPDKDDRCPTVAGVVAQQGCPEIEEEVQEQLEAIAKDIEFEFNSANLRESSKTVLDQIIDIMEQYPEYTLMIEGHTDNIGSDSYNLKLSKDRAASARQYLIDKGVDADRMESEGYGETKPEATNQTPEGRAQNRRVELKLQVK